MDVPCDGAAFPAPLHSLNPSECSVTVARLQGEPTPITIMKTQHAATLTELIDVLVTWGDSGRGYGWQAPTVSMEPLCSFLIAGSPRQPLPHARWTCTNERHAPTFPLDKNPLAPPCSTFSVCHLLTYSMTS